jgi:hypothetical protein
MAALTTQGRKMSRFAGWAATLAGLFVLTLSVPLQAQGRSPELYFPLSQQTPPGMAGYWAATLGKAGVIQQIRVELPSRGQVTFYNRSADRPVAMSAPAQLGVGVGYIYRLQISNMPEFPGIELYPSVEVLDRLHPPPGKADAFPIPVQFTREEIEFALSGRLVTKVVYLEQPQLAMPGKLPNPTPVLTIPPHKNLLAAADRVGRPMLILRLGGRLPDIHGNGSEFFGNGAPVFVSKPEDLQKP